MARDYVILATVQHAIFTKGCGQWGCERPGWKVQLNRSDFLQQPETHMILALLQ